MNTDAFYRKIAKSIKKDGMMMMGVFSDGTRPSFTYTIGLYEKYGYEVILVGVPNNHAGHILNSVRDSLKAGFEIELGKVYAADAPENTWARANTRFMLCDSPELYTDYAVQAQRYYANAITTAPEIPVYQMVIPDRAGRMPEDPAYDHAYMDHRQPLLYGHKGRH